MNSTLNIARFLDDCGKITQLSRKRELRIATLSYLSEKFSEHILYTEKEVNQICNEWHTFGDYFILRRELIDNGFLCRNPNGSTYWKTQQNEEESL